eukprot:SAG22_NODE_120_length_19227_cov_7.584013_12_plen_83_part_00
MIGNGLLEKDCSLATCGHTFARAHAEHLLGQNGSVRDAVPSTVAYLPAYGLAPALIGTSRGRYVDCPFCSAPFGACEIKNMF